MESLAPLARNDFCIHRGMVTDALAPLDYAIIVAYFAIVAIIGVWVARRVSTEQDLFLAGRSLGAGLIGLSLFASNVSSTTLIGLAGQAYDAGISVANYEWIASLVLVFTAVFVVPRYLGARVATVPEFLGLRFDQRTRYYFSAMSIVISIVVDTAGSLYAAALVLQIFFPAYSIWEISLAMALVTGVYTAAGGLKADVYTDALQTVVLLAGSILLAGYVFAEFDFSWSAVTAAVPADKLSLIRPLDDPALPWLGTLIGLPVLGIYFWSMNQFIVQRVLGARSVQAGRDGATLAALLKLAPLFIMVLPGVLAARLYPDIERADLVFPTLLTELLPVGAVGVVMAGLMAALMSSIDSTLNSASTLLTLDFIQPRYRGLTHRQLLWIGRLTTIGFMFLSASWAPLIESFPGLFAYLQQVLSYIVPPFVAIFLLGLFWRRLGRSAAFWTLPLGHALCLACFLLERAEILRLHFTIMAGLLTAACALLAAGLSLLEVPPMPAPQLEPPGPRLPWWRDHRWHAAAIVALTAAIVVGFW
jgi:solute:Na+ symporter, SSS family